MTDLCGIQVYCSTTAIHIRREIEFSLVVVFEVDKTEVGEVHEKKVRRIKTPAKIGRNRRVQVELKVKSEE